MPHSLVPLVPAASKIIEVKENPEDGSTKSSETSVVYGRQHGVTPLTTVFRHFNCSFQIADVHTNNTIITAQ
jgi:hypothetical protein